MLVYNALKTEMFCTNCYNVTDRNTEYNTIHINSAFKNFSYFKLDGNIHEIQCTVLAYMSDGQGCNSSRMAIH